MRFNIKIKHISWTNSLIPILTVLFVIFAVFAEFHISPAHSRSRNLMNKYSSELPATNTRNKTSSKTSDTAYSSSYKNSGSTNSGSIASGSDTSGFINHFNPENKDISKALLKPYKFSWSKNKEAEIASADLDFIMVFHPEMQFFLPEQKSFIKGASKSIKPEKLKFMVNEKLKKAASDKKSLAKIRKIEKKIIKTEEKIKNLLVDKNREYEAAHKKTRVSENILPLGPTPDTSDNFKNSKQTSYPEMIKKIDQNFNIKKMQYEKTLLELTNEKQRLLSSSYSQIFTNQLETQEKFKKIELHIQSQIDAYCKKSGFKTVFNSSFDRSFFFDPALYMKSNLTNKTLKKDSNINKPEFNEYKNNEYIKFMDSSQTLKTFDNGEPMNYQNELRAWYNSNQQIKNSISALRSSSFMISGGQDITPHIIYLIFKDMGLPKEKALFVIDIYNRVQNEKKKLLNLYD